jgi:hypothetical protein
VGSRRACTWILGLLGFRVVTAERDGETTDSRLTIRIERRGVAGTSAAGAADARSRAIGAGSHVGRCALGHASRDARLCATVRICRLCAVRVVGLAVLDCWPTVSSV